MDSLRFWENWEPGIRKLFVFAGTIAILLILALIVSSWRSPSPTITWAYLQEREVVDKPAHQFQTGPFSLQVTASNMILKEHLVGNEFVFQVWPAYLFLAATLLGLIFLTSILSTLSRFWFFIGSGILIFLLSGLQLELLKVLGQENQGASIFLIVLIVGTGVLFQYYFQSAAIMSRILVFSGIFIGAFALLLMLSAVPNPAYLLAVGFIPSAIIGSVLLALVAAHEIIATIIYLVTRGLKGSNGFLHITLLTFIYMTNLVATYLNDQNYLNWDYSLNPILLLALSATLTVWGIRRQQEQMNNFLLDGPTGPLAIAGLLIVASGSSAFFYTTGNDAAIETIRNMSLYAHISYGIIFFLYVVSNFGALLKENYPVSKVLYKPTSMPFFTYRLAGTITLAGFVLYNFWLRPVRDTTGARDAAMGDYFVVTNNLSIAEGYYKKSDYNAFHNHHANYVLGNIESAQGNRFKERQYYLNAAERRPTQQAYMNVINTLDKNPINRYAYLKDVKKDFPNSGAANNALGLVHAALNQLDSAILFFNRARKDNATSATAEINLLATAIKQNIDFNVDSVFQNLSSTKPGPLANTFALANNEGAYLDQSISLPKDSLLDLFTSSLINNYVVNHIDSLDTAFISQVEKLARHPNNKVFFEEALSTCAVAYYKCGMINRAFITMQEAAAFNRDPGKQNNTMALWALEQSAPKVALDYSQYSASQGYEGALLTQAISLAEAGRTGEAIVLFDSIRRHSKDLAPLAESLQRILAIDPKLVKELNDLEKYSYCRYRLSYSDSLMFNSVSQTITDPNWKSRAILDRSKKLYEWGELDEAIRIYHHLNGIAITDKRLFTDIQIHELMLAWEAGNIQVVQDKLPAIPWTGMRLSEKLFLESVVATAQGDSVTMKNNMKWITINNAFCSEGILMAAQLEGSSNDDPLAAYNILAGALHLNPQSIKILKEYIREASTLGFDEYVLDAQQTLQQILPGPLFIRFLNTLQ